MANKKKLFPFFPLPLKPSIHPFKQSLNFSTSQQQLQFLINIMIQIGSVLIVIV